MPESLERPEPEPSNLLSEQEQYIVSLLHDSIRPKIDFLSDEAQPQFRTREEAEKALKDTIKSRQIGSSVILTFHDGSKIEVGRYLGIPDVEFNQNSSEDPIASMKYDSYELDQDAASALLNLPNTSERIKSAKLTFWLS